MMIYFYVTSQKAACSSAFNRNSERTAFLKMFFFLSLSNAAVNYSVPDAYALGQDHIWSKSEFFCRGFLLPGEWFKFHCTRASGEAKDRMWLLQVKGGQEQPPHRLSIGAIKSRGKKEGQLGRDLEEKGSGSGQANFRRHRTGSENPVLAWTISPLSFPRSGTVKFKWSQLLKHLKTSFGRQRCCVLQH